MNRAPITHVVIMDGTLSTLADNNDSNAGLTYKMLGEIRGSEHLSLTYEAGIQWYRWRSVVDLAAGTGINGQIRRAYGSLASRYRPGDKIFFFGFSRGAYAVRSLAGIIDRIGLLRPEHAIERNVRQVFRHYRHNPDGAGATAIARKLCQIDVRIEMIGVWDTVKALGIQYPFLWRLAPAPTEFHTSELGPCTKNGFQALAMDETRNAFTPILWATDPHWKGTLKQVWFRGAHPDIGGHIGDFQAARPLSNIPLVWMLDHAENCGLPLPKNWQSRFPQDVTAPPHGANRGIARFFLSRKKRRILTDPSESLHQSVVSASAESGSSLHPDLRA